MLLDGQRSAFRLEGVVTAKVRIDRLGRALALLVNHQAQTAPRPPAISASGPRR